MKAIHSSTSPKAWAEAMTVLSSAPRELQDLVIEISSPQDLDGQDLSICREVDAFLRTTKDEGLEYVANNLFPLALYERDGWPKMAEVYRRNAERRADRGWGSYFGRLVHQSADGEVSNLDVLVGRLKRRPGRRRNAYESGLIENGSEEFAIYNDASDRRSTRLPCLTHLSVRVFANRLCVTGIYRSHYYAERALGNFLGLGRFQAFLAQETGHETGSICIHSCHAQLKGDKKCSARAVDDLLQRVRNLPADAVLRGRVMDRAAYLTM